MEGITNLSLGSERSLGVEATVAGAADAGAVMVVAAGNNNQDAHLYIQLDWTSNTSRQKNNLPANQKGYDTFETTVGKLGEENSDLPGLFLFRHYFESYSI